MAGPPAALPIRFELTTTPFFSQSDFLCGPAALATLLTASGVVVTPEQLVAEVYLPNHRGSLQAEMVVAIRHHRRFGYPVSPQLVDLFIEIAAGHPVLVLQNRGLDWLPRWHYAVVVGYDLERQVVIMRSGEVERLETPLSLFERGWARGGYWGYLALSGGDLPEVAEPLTTLGVVEAFAANAPAEARASFSAAARRWPVNPLVWMVLGNSYYAGQHYAAAAEAFSTSARLAPTAAAGWNNLAYALVAKGCGESGEMALNCGERLAAGDATLAASRTELTPRLGVQGSGCPTVTCPAESLPR